MSEVPPPELIANMVELLKETIGPEKAVERLNAIEEAMMAIDNEAHGRDLLYGVLIPVEEVAKEAIAGLLALAASIGYTPDRYVARQRAIVLAAKAHFEAEAS